jgi:hypothetical protein
MPRFVCETISFSISKTAQANNVKDIFSARRIGVIFDIFQLCFGLSLQGGQSNSCHQRLQVEKRSFSIYFFAPKYIIKNYFISRQNKNIIFAPK